MIRTTRGTAFIAILAMLQSVDVRAQTQEPSTSTFSAHIDPAFEQYRNRIKSGFAVWQDEATVERVLDERDQRGIQRKQQTAELESLGIVNSLIPLMGDMELWSDGAADRSLLFGVATPDEQRRLAICAADVAFIVKLATDECTTYIAAVEHEAAANPREETERRTVALIHWRDTRLPLAGARASLLLASLLPVGDLRTELVQQSSSLAQRAETPSAWAKSEQALLQGLAALMSDDAASAVRFFAAAKEAANAPGGDAAPEVAGAIAPDLAIGAALATRKLKDTASALAVVDRAEAAGVFKDFGERDLYLSIGAAEARLRLARTAENDGAKAAAEAAAYNAFRSILDSREFAEPLAARRAAVIEQLGPIVPSDAAPASLPAVALVARGAWLLDSGKADEALPLLELAASKADSDLGALKITALDRFARALQRDGASADELARAMDVFLSIARDHKDDPEAPGAALRACAAAERAWMASKPSPTAAPDADRRVKIFSVFRFAHDTPLEVPHRDELRARFINLLTSDLGSVGAVKAIPQVREAERVCGSLIHSPSLSALARLDLARGWMQLASMYPGHEEAFTDQELDGTQAMKNARSQAWTAWRAAEQAPPDEAPALLRKAAALEASAFLQLSDPKQAWERLAAIPSFDLSAEENNDLLAVGARTLAVRGDVDHAREWVSRLETLSPESARAAMAMISRDAWFKITPLVAGFAADTNPDRVPPEPVAVLRFATNWEGWSTDAERREQDRRLAWALVLTGDADNAAKMFHKLIDDSAPTPDLLRGLAEADLRAGRDEPAFAGLKRLAADLEAKRDFSRDYWHAWTRMIEILNRQNADGSRTPIIRREIARLEMLPTAKHQADCIQRFQRIKEKLPEAGGSPTP
ncbi:MAG TPA: hypothetical protein VG797_09585 [Phycisphaerales bacterium]|nr:hypothetical protein [Phycisphaerales bacterium]